MRTFDDHTLAGFWQDPLSVFQKSFASGDRLQANPGGGFAVLGYDALSRLGRHPAMDGTPMPASSRDQPSATTDLMRHALFTQVAPRHRPLRTAVLAGVNFAAVDAFRPEAERRAGARLDALRGAPFDLVADFVRPVVADAWCGFMGYEAGSASALASDVERVTGQLTFASDPAYAEDAEQAAASMLARTAAMLRTARGGPALGVAAAIPGGDPEVAAGVVASLLLDAIDTGVAGLSGLLAVLLRQPETHDRLGDAVFREAAIEEALRLATPAVLTVRQASEDVAFDGLRIEKGALVLMYWAAGNVDPAVFEQPLRFRPGRPKRGMPFGVGAHSCPGHVWIKMLAHTLVRLAFAGERRLTALTQHLTWVTGGARRPHGLIVACD